MRRILSYVGAAAIAITVLLVAYVGYQWTVGNRTQIDKATPSDVRFVLNWGELGELTVEKVEHSHVSSRNLTGDHLDAFAIKLAAISPEQLKTRPETGVEWIRGDLLPPIAKEAASFLESWRSEIPWFPAESYLQSTTCYVYPRKTEFMGKQVTASDLIFACPADRRIYYFSGET